MGGYEPLAELAKWHTPHWNTIKRNMGAEIHSPLPSSHPASESSARRTSEVLALQSCERAWRPHGSHQIDRFLWEFAGFPVPVTEQTEMGAGVHERSYVPAVHFICAFRAVLGLLRLVAGTRPRYVVAENNREIGVIAPHVANDVVHHLHLRAGFGERSGVRVGDQCRCEGFLPSALGDEAAVRHDRFVDAVVRIYVGFGSGKSLRAILLAIPFVPGYTFMHTKGRGQSGRVFGL